MTSGEKRTRLVHIHVMQCPECGAWAAAQECDGLIDCIDCEHNSELMHCIVEAEIPTNHIVIRGTVRDAD